MLILDYRYPRRSFTLLAHNMSIVVGFPRPEFRGLQQYADSLVYQMDATILSVRHQASSSLGRSVLSHAAIKDTWWR